jgi:putative glutamine amidotransferase
MGRPEQMVIGVSDCGAKFENYTRWLETASRQIRIIKLSYHLQNESEVDRCDGVLLTGGGDLHPKLFRRPEAVIELDPHEIDSKRDEYEMAIVGRVLRRGAPMLGICRGMQLVNVYQDGDIVLDLKKIGKNDHRAIRDAGIGDSDEMMDSVTSHHEDRDRVHPVIVDSGSMLYRYVQVTKGMVNSSHHQAIGRVGKQLRAVAWSDDGVVEALESTGVQGEFVLLVQWHPERMAFDNAFSYGVRGGFLDAARQYALTH